MPLLATKSDAVVQRTRSIMFWATLVFWTCLILSSQERHAIILSSFQEVYDLFVLEELSALSRFCVNVTEVNKLLLFFFIVML